MPRHSQKTLRNLIALMQSNLANDETGVSVYDLAEAWGGSAAKMAQMLRDLEEQGDVLKVQFPYWKCIAPQVEVD